MIQNCIKHVNSFLFTPISAKGFSLMRIAWGIQLLITTLNHWLHYDVLFSMQGVLGPMQCSGTRCIIVSSIFTEPWIHVTFFAMVFSLIMVILGVKPRMFIAMAFVLLIFFHYRNWFILNGGNRIEKVIGFLLLIAPNMHMYSADKIKSHINTVWVQRLLLWQLIILYSTAGTRKLQVDGWLDGNMLGLSLHSEQFMRLPPEWLSFMNAWYIPASFFTVGIQISWLLLLIPKQLRKPFIWRQWPLNLKQTILLGTALMHLNIFILMEVDMFAITMMISYFGLLDTEDFVAYKKVLQRCLTCIVNGLNWCKKTIITLEKHGTLQYSDHK